MTHPYPILDGPRANADAELSRFVIDDELQPVTPWIDETDSYVELPLRVVYHQGSGVHVELGPYSMDESDIERLRAAITAYDTARGAE